MKRRRNSKKRPSRSMRAIRLWPYGEAIKAVPYLRSVVGSLRDYWLEAQTYRLEGERLTKLSGKPTRDVILKAEKLSESQARAEDRFNESLEELMKIDVFLMDAVQGIALIPFRKENDLAWYVYDHFGATGLNGWRYHNDPLGSSRPLTAAEEPPPGTSLPTGVAS